MASLPIPSLRDQFTARVIANVPVCREHFRLVLELDSFPLTEPGQFVQLACRDLATDYSPEAEFDWQPGMSLEMAGRELMSPLAMLRRPFSLAGRRDTARGVEIDIIHRIVGVGTDWLAKLKLGDAVDVLGPLGNRFVLPPPGGVALLVGGGVGIPPMIYLAEKFAGHPQGRSAVVFSGALTRDLLPLNFIGDALPPGPDSFEALYNIEEFARHGVPAVISTDDGSFGFRGFVTQALERYLDGRPEGPGLRTEARKCDIGSSSLSRTLIIYTCGPEPMMKRVAQIAADRGIECQVAVERAMACGMGTCQSCCIRLRRDPQRDGNAFAGKDWIYKLACTDGPVFKGADLLW